LGLTLCFVCVIFGGFEFEFEFGFELDLDLDFGLGLDLDSGLGSVGCLGLVLGLGKVCVWV